MERETGKRLTFSQKWGDDPFTQSGHTQVPNALISYAHRLGLRSEECWLITCILKFKYDSSNPTPSQEKLAELFGQSVDTVQRTLKKIVDKRLLKVERVRDEETHRFTHTVYDFTPLRFALNECHYQEHPEERPQMPIFPEKATPQKCGMDTQTHTAEMRHGFSREPHRRIAAWATPQKCGLDIRNKKSINVKEKEALNVREGEDSDPTASTLNEGERGIYAIRDKAVSEVVALTGDEGSLRRFQQLWEIAEGKGALDAWNAALRATQRRLGGNAKQTLDRPGAYFDKICVAELEKREVFVPTIAEKQSDLGVGDIIRQRLFGGEDRLSAGESPMGGAEEPAPQDAIKEVVAPPLTTTELAAELAALESQGGAAYEAFQGFCESERKRYEAEMGKVSPSSRERLLAVFDRPEKRRDLYKRWKATLTEQAALLQNGAVLCSSPSDSR